MVEISSQVGQIVLNILVFCILQNYLNRRIEDGKSDTSSLTAIIFRNLSTSL